MAEVPVPIGAIYKGGDSASLNALRANEEASKMYAPSVFSPHTLSEKGHKRVAKDRVPKGKNKRPTDDAISKGATLPSQEAGFDVYYEVHGKGPKKIICLMGLNNSCFGWLQQVERFGSDPDYSILVIDNRGYGNSETPAGFYTTSSMAKDALEVLDQIGWTADRQLHVVGVSMGGMITLEIAKLAPKRVASINLVSTTSGQGRGEKNLLTSLPPLTGVTTIARVIAGRILNMDSDQWRVGQVLELLFPKVWLAEVHPEDPSGRTRRDVMREMFEWRFAYTRRQTLPGAFAQIGAVATHRVTPKELAAINLDIPAIAIFTGDQDNLVNPANSFHLHKHLPRADFTQYKNAGHALPVQKPQELNDALQKNFEKAAAHLANSASGPWPHFTSVSKQ
ncbi:alpha/beta-hydrolase [Ceraceosorus guamensis]|uniref:Alpha/beta-hydrolase n=1 Tax=Ceraceosorus guamensis TaxID=1522189 RepID=A0A316W0M9_9BASI|nr:alpha/beta-hydrolase [Ceraceosorus guamensis]PWN42283.1 alpha/beta-hydrolase [Ceraceosorus guamensis]